MSDRIDPIDLAANGPIAIAGAGLAGSLAAIYLGRAGYDVTVYESRSDLRRVDIDAGRSINLALATRGIVPLIDVGVIDKVDAITIPMRGRMIHPKIDASQASPTANHSPAGQSPTGGLQPYGSSAHEVIHSVSRTDLNGILLDAAEATGRVVFEFDRPVERIDLEDNVLRFTDGSAAPFGFLVGADGAGSRVRAAMAAMGSCEFETEWLDHDYKELTLPAGTDGSHQLDPHALHIWPRGEFMLIALANPGGDFTITLFAPKQTFAELGEPSKVNAFFEQHFSDFAALVPDLVEQFFANPTGVLGTLWANGWSYKDRAVLVGDSAHAIVPFHGQGMNAALESVRHLLSCVTQPASPSFAAALKRYEHERKPSADAIARMAKLNYVEMRSGVVDPDYLAKRSLALDLERRHPKHLSPRYNMVMFSTMPYAEAEARAERQADIIAKAIADPSLDVDALVAALDPLPALDPLVDPGALSA